MARFKQLQRNKSNVEIDGNGVAVAVSCHICHFNVSHQSRYKRNPFSDLDGLRRHHLIKHKDEVKTRGMSDNDVFNVCKKVKISAEDLDYIGKGQEPKAANLAAVSYGGMLLRVPLSTISQHPHNFLERLKVHSAVKHELRRSVTCSK